jgi:hypothetical protein
MNDLPFNKPSSRFIRDGRRVPVFRPVPTDLGAAAMLGSRLHHPNVLAISSAGSSCRSDLYCDFHGQMIRRGPKPCALQRDRFARVVRDRDADEVLISHDASRRIEVDPAWTGNVDLDPGVSVAAGSAVVVVIGQMHISGYEPRGNSAQAQRGYHQHCEVTTTAAPEIECPDRSLDALLVPRYVFDGPPDGPRHVDEQLVSVGRSVFAEEHRAPAINRAMRGQRPNEAFEVGPICRRVGKRIGAGKIFYIGCAKIGRRMVETNITDKAELAGSVCEVGGRHVIAKSIPHPGKLLWSGRDFELGLEYLLVAVIAGTQHHPVLAEGDRLIIVICRNVSDAENRHCRPMIMDTPATCIATAYISTTCISWARYCACFFRNRERQ